MTELKVIQIMLKLHGEKVDHSLTGDLHKEQLGYWKKKFEEYIENYLPGNMVFVQEDK